MTYLERLERDPLDSVVAWVYDKVKTDSSWLDGSAMAILAKRLIAAEVAPGGPYKNDAQVVDGTLNRNIAELFQAVGISLPGVVDYLPAAAPKAAQPLAADHPLQPAQSKTAAIIAGYNEPLRTVAATVYDSIRKVDHAGELSRLAELFGTSLSPRPQCDYEALGAANLLTWMAYSLYDDFLDEEGEPRTLPVANAAHRDAYALYCTHAPAYADAISETFRAMDEANAWELAHCRFVVDNDTITIGPLPEYGANTILAERAGAHVLGALIVLDTADRPDTVDDVRASLYYYLIARQLNDDLHDWVEDTQNGHISPVVAHLLRRLDRTGDQPLAATIKAMRDLFWNAELETLSQLALDAIIRAEVQLIDVGLMDADAPFIREIYRPIRTSLEHGLRRHAHDKTFYETYRSRLA